MASQTFPFLHTYPRLLFYIQISNTAIGNKTVHSFSQLITLSSSMICFMNDSATEQVTGSMTTSAPQSGVSLQQLLIKTAMPLALQELQMLQTWLEGCYSWPGGSWLVLYLRVSRMLPFLLSQELLPCSVKPTSLSLKNREEFFSLYVVELGCCL